MKRNRSQGRGDTDVEVSKMFILSQNCFPFSSKSRVFRLALVYYNNLGMDFVTVGRKNSLLAGRNLL